MKRFKKPNKMHMVFGSLTLSAAIFVPILVYVLLVTTEKYFGERQEALIGGVLSVLLFVGMILIVPLLGKYIQRSKSSDTK